MKKTTLLRTSAFVAFSIIVLLFPACGDDKNKCQECSTWTSCPAITKQCPWGTKTVQECSGSCCTTDPNKIDCSMAAAYGWNGSYERYEDKVVVKLYGGGRYARVEIDATANGWLLPGMTDEEMASAIHDKMMMIRESGQL